MKREAMVFTCDICGERETVGPHETPRTIEFQIDWAEKCQDKDPWQTKHICADCLKEANACVPNAGALPRRDSDVGSSSLLGGNGGKHE